MRLVDGDALYKQLQDDEELARNRVLDTESALPYSNNINPAYTRYLAQMDERTRLKNMVADAPAIEPDVLERNVGKWIPCSERLPKDYEDVLVWFEYFRYGSYNRLYQTHGIGDYSSEFDSWMINHESGWHKLRVFAWMPLPEPYQEVEE